MTSKKREKPRKREHSITSKTKGQTHKIAESGIETIALGLILAWRLAVRHIKSPKAALKLAHFLLSRNRDLRQTHKIAESGIETH